MDPLGRHRGQDAGHAARARRALGGDALRQLHPPPRQLAHRGEEVRQLPAATSSSIPSTASSSRATAARATWPSASGCSRRTPDSVRAVFIHDVVATPEPIRQAWREQRIFFFDTYVGAAVEAFEVGVISRDGVARVAHAAREDLAEIAFASEAQREARQRGAGAGPPARRGPHRAAVADMTPTPAQVEGRSATSRPPASPSPRWCSPPPRTGWASRQVKGRAAVLRARVAYLSAPRCPRCARAPASRSRRPRSRRRRARAALADVTCPEMVIFLRK